MFGYIFGNNIGGVPSYEDLQRRKRIAEMMAARQRGMPKNIGEGLTAIGEAIGEMGLDARIKAQERASQQYGAQRMANAPTGQPRYVPYSPDASKSYQTPAQRSEVTPDTALSAAEAVASAPAMDTENPAYGGVGNFPAPIPAATPAQESTLPPTTSWLEDTVDQVRKEGSPDTRPTVGVPVPVAPPQDQAQAEPAPNEAGRTRISAQLANAIERIESGGNPNSVTGSYKGAFQLSDSEFKRYGGQGSIFNRDENKRVAMMKLQDEADQVSRQLGRPLTDGEIYLVHQQGVGGALAHLRNPDQPAWQNMYSTGEGRQKGPGWSRQAITGNIPGDVRDRYGPDVSSRDFAQMWSDKVARFSGARPTAAPAASAQPPAEPALSPTAVAQDETLGLLAGRGEGDSGGVSYPRTASRSGDIASDAPPLGMSPGTSQSVIDSVQAGRNAVTKAMAKQGAPPAPVPYLNNPTVVSDIAPAPGPNDQLAQAQTPLGQITTGRMPSNLPPVPPLPNVPPPMQRPPQPNYLPEENERTRYYNSLIGDPRLDPQTRAGAQKSLENELTSIRHINERLRADYAPYQQQYLQQQAKQSDPASIYATEKARRELQGEGAYPLTAEQKKAYGFQPDAQVWFNNRGEIKTPSGTSVSIDQRQEGAEAQTRGKHAADAENELRTAARGARAGLSVVSRAEYLTHMVETGAMQPGKTTTAAIARDLGMSDETLKKLNLPTDIGPRQALAAITNEMVQSKLAAKEFPSNNFSNTDRDFLTQTVISLGDDPTSNRIKLAALRFAHERNLEVADAWAKYRTDPANKGKSYFDFEDSWNAKVAGENKTGAMRQQVEDMMKGAGATPGAAAPTAPAQLPPDLPPVGNHPPGTTARKGNMIFEVGPDGQWRAKGQ